MSLIFTQNVVETIVKQLVCSSHSHVRVQLA